MIVAKVGQRKKQETVTNCSIPLFLVVRVCLAAQTHESSWETDSLEFDAFPDDVLFLKIRVLPVQPIHFALQYLYSVLAHRRLQPAEQNVSLYAPLWV